MSESQTVIRHNGAAALVAAIRAAALEVPEIRPELEFPERYGSIRYPFTVPAELEIGACVYMSLHRSLNVGCAFIEEVTDGAACKWPRLNVHPEAPGPFLPITLPARITFAYATPDGARGSLTVANNRASLVALADKVHAKRALFDGKTKRAPRPGKAPAASAPHVAAREMWRAGDFAGALTLAQVRGAVFIGTAGHGTPGVAYMDAESCELAGHAFTIARGIVSGKFRVLHTPSGCAVDTVRAGAPSELGFPSYTAALDWLETRTADEEFRARLDAGAAKAAPFDQSAALAHYMGADAAPADENGAQRDETAPAGTVAAETAPDAPTGPESAPLESDAAIIARGRINAYAYLPNWARVTIERMDADADMRTGKHARELARAYAATYGAECDADTLASILHIAARRFHDYAPILAAPACIVARVVVESPALQATADCRHQSDASRRVRWAQSQTNERARILRDARGAPAAWQSVGFEFRARGADRCADAQAWRDATARAVRAARRLKRAPEVREVSAAEFADTVARAQLRSAAAWMARACMLDAPDTGRASAITQARAGNVDAAPAILAHLARIAANGRTADLRRDAEETARALSDALAELARETSAPPTPQSNTPTAQSEPCAAEPPTAQSEAPAAAPRSREEIAAGIRSQWNGLAREMACGGRWHLYRDAADGFVILRDDAASDVPLWIWVSYVHAMPLSQVIGQWHNRMMHGAPISGAPDIAPPTPQSQATPDAAISGGDARALPDWVAKALAEAQARRELAAELAASGDSVRFTYTGDATRYGIAGPDMSGADAFRFTYFDERGPVGHAGAVSLAAACDDALQRGYAPIPDAAIPGESFAQGFAYGSAPHAAELTAREIEALFPGVDGVAFAEGMRDALAGDAWRAARIPTAHSDTDARPCVAIYSDDSFPITRARAAYLIRAARSRGQVCSVRRVGLHSFAIDGARLRIVTGGRPWLPTVQSEKFEAAAVRADAIGNTRRAEVCRELAEEARAEPIPCGEVTELHAETIEAAAPPTVQPAAGPWRISACNRPEYAPPNRTVHVIFAANRKRAAGEGGEAAGECVGFYMSRQTYHAIPYDVEATPADFERYGPLQSAPDDYLWSEEAQRIEAKRNGADDSYTPPPTVQPAARPVPIRDLLPRVLAHVHREARTAPRAPLGLHPMDPRRRIPGAFRPSYVLAAHWGAL